MKRIIVMVMNVLIAAFTVLGIGIMLYLNGNDGGLLSSSGWENFRYFTVLSNVFCGIVACVFLILQLCNVLRHCKNRMAEKERMREMVKELTNANDGPTAVFVRKGREWTCPAWMMTLKLAAAAAVMVTFLVVACFFGPLYTYPVLYRGSNLWFHLIIPVLGMAEFCLLDGEIPFRMTFLTGAPALVYGCFYLGNILINGKGEWPDTNDWYGFMNWGFGPAMVIFAGIVLTSWGAACLLRRINRLANRKI